MPENLRFVHPQLLALMLLVVFVAVGAARHYHCLKNARAQFNLVSRRRRTFIISVTRVLASAVLLSLVTVLLALVLARPQIRRAQASEIVRRLDLVFLLDVSPSMYARDIAPSRLEKACEFISDVITRDTTIARAGLVTFSGSSVILSYLTSDVENVLFYLDYLKAQGQSSLGTNIGEALDSGLKVFESAREKDPRAAGSNRKVLVLLSDGEDHGEQLRQALARASQRNLRVYTIGIGSSAGGFVPIQSDDGKMRFLEDALGTRILSRLDERTLRHVAQATGGRFYRSYQGAEIGTALAEIISEEKEVIGYEKRTEWRDVYHYLISGAAVLFLAAVTLSRE